MARLNPESPPAKPHLHRVNTPTPVPAASIPRSPTNFSSDIHPTKAAAGSVGSKHWKRSTKTLRAAQWPILPRASLRAQDRPRGAPHGMPPHRQNHSAALPTTNRENSERTRIQRLKASPSSHTIRPAGGSGIDPKQALEAIHKNPARSAKADPPPSFPASAGPFPRSPSRNTFIVKSVPFCVDMRD